MTPFRDRVDQAGVDYLRIVVRALQQKLEADPPGRAFIVDELGVGYRPSSAPD